jgi:hypothetical protein
MSDAIENEMHCALPELQITTNSMQKKISGYKGKLSEFPRGRIINYM